MPNYLYECTNENCRHQFELIQGIHEEHIANCPRCSVKAKRIYTPINSTWNCGGAFGRSDNR